MRGDDEQSGHLFSYLSPEQRVPADHPLRTIRAMTDEALRRLSPRFEAIDASTGRPSIPPEHLLRALLLQVLYSVRSERMLMEQLEYNLLFRWFVGLGMGRPHGTKHDLARCYGRVIFAMARPRSFFALNRTERTSRVPSLHSSRRTQGANSNFGRGKEGEREPLR